MSEIIFTKQAQEFENDFEKKVQLVLWGLRNFALKAGRVAARPLLQAYYVMTEGNLSSKEKIKLYAALAYILLPGDLIPARVFHFLGVADDMVAMALVYKVISSRITDAINLRVDQKLDEWFGYQITRV